MKRIGKFSQRPQNGDFRTLTFKSSDGTEMFLDSRTFFIWDNHTNEFSKINGKYKDYLNTVIGDNQLYFSYEIELNDAGYIIKIEDMPMQARYLKEFFLNHRNDFENYALLVQKFGRFKEKKLEYMDAAGTDLFHKFTHNEGLTNMLKEKQELTQSELSTNPKISVVSQSMKQHWRFTMGLGNASAYNNGFTFHPVYGIPYLPGQNIKGILRNYIINECYSQVPSEIMDDVNITSKMEYFAEQDPVFCEYFGCSEKSYDQKARAGSLMFLDAFPYGNYRIEPDIMNPHYKEYYKDSNPEPPHDAMKLTPIIFLSMKDAEFTFCFYSSDKDLSQKVKFNKKELLPVEFLKEALHFNGIGAKTKVGYGRFHPEN